MTEISNSLAGSGESCPNCGAGMSSDQRYCLNCGNRRGDPRLPFMDAVVFMEAMSGPPDGAAAAAPPPPPAESKPRFNSSATLIAGIATLILAVGVGVLIGQSGNDSSAPAAAAKPTVIQVGGNGGGEEAASTGNGGAAKTPKGSTGKGKEKSKGKASPKQAKKAEAKAETGNSGTAKGVEEVIKPENGVKIAPPEQKLGGSCEEGTAGCEGGKFEGNFFGE